MFDFFRLKRTKRTTVPLLAEWDPRLLIDEIQAVVIDTELTGLDHKCDNIVSLGAVKVNGSRVEIGQTFYQLVNPGREMRAQTVMVHEITPSEIQEKPDIVPVLGDFLDYCGNDIIVGHFINIDLSFINRELRKIDDRTLANPVIDTMALMHYWRANSAGQGPDRFTAESFELVAIAKELGVQVQGAHNALMDAFMTAQVYQRLLPRLKEKGLRTLGDLLRAGNPEKRLDAPQGMMQPV
jgi:DNA polymerase-3 subunit epsilon